MWLATLEFRELPSVHDKAWPQPRQLGVDPVDEAAVVQNDAKNSTDWSIAATISSGTSYAAHSDTAIRERDLPASTVMSARRRSYNPIAARRFKQNATVSVQSSNSWTTDHSLVCDISCPRGADIFSTPRQTHRQAVLLINEPAATRILRLPAVIPILSVLIQNHCGELSRSCVPIARHGPLAHAEFHRCQVKNRQRQRNFGSKQGDLRNTPTLKRAVAENLTRKSWLLQTMQKIRTFTGPLTAGVLATVHRTARCLRRSSGAIMWRPGS